LTVIIVGFRVKGQNFPKIGQSAAELSPECFSRPHSRLRYSVASVWWRTYSS